MFVQKCVAGQSVPNQIGGVVGDVFGGPDRDDVFYTFNFSAESGHIYEVAGETLVDITSDSQVVARAPAMAGRIEDRSTGDAYVCESDYSQRRGGWSTRCVGELKAAIIRPGGTTVYGDTCWPSAGSVRGRIIFLVVDAGPVSIDATCSKVLQSSARIRKTSSFDFDAETGHIYTMSGEGEECMSLLDITSEETVIACEPYHEVPTR
jgi:hypothetical protein